MRIGYKFNRKTVMFMIAIAFGGVGALASHYYMDKTINEIRHQEAVTASVIVAKEDLAPGASITTETVSIRQVPMEWMQSGAIKPEEFGSVEGSIMKSALGQGEMLMWAMVERAGDQAVSSLVAKGRRAVTLPVDEISSLSGMLQPGDMVDLIVTVERDNGPRSYPLLQKMRVIATGSRRKPAADTEEGVVGYTAITLDASPEEARRLIAARDGGRITAMLRNPADLQSLPDYRPEDAVSVRGHYSATAIPGRREQLPAGVRIVYGDKP